MATTKRKKNMNTETTLAWHWVTTNDDGQPVLRDGTLVEAGTTYRLPRGAKPVLCERGYHASLRALDSLPYAPGTTICRVEMSGHIEHDTDKLVASERRVLWMADATMVLHEFACRCAEDALRAERAEGREPDPRSFAAIETKRRWILGKATDDELAAARDAAGAAAGAAGAAAGTVRAAAGTVRAAAGTVRAAAGTVRAAAWAAAGTAAWAAVRTAAWAAVRAKYNGWLEEMLLALGTVPEEAP
jgi:hypothetical protein